MIARVSSVAFPIRAGLPPKNFLTQSAFALGVRNWYPPATSTKRIPRFSVSNSLCSSLRVLSMMFLFVPSSTSLKRCTDCGPSATSKRLSRMDFTSSRSMLAFPGFVKLDLFRRFIHSCRGLDHDRPHHFFLKDSNCPHFDQLQHRQKRHHDLDAAFNLNEKRLEKHAAMGPQCFQQQRHLFPHGDLVERDLMDGLLGQAVNDAFEGAQELEYRYLTKASRTNFFGGCRRANKDIPSEKVALLQLGGGFFIALVF